MQALLKRAHAASAVPWVPTRALALAPIRQQLRVAAAAVPGASGVSRSTNAAASTSGISLKQQPAATQRLIALPPLPARRSVACAATEGENSSTSGDQDNSGWLISAGLLAIWAGIMTYVCVFAPNQTPTIDAFVVEKLVGMKQEDPFQVNAAFAAIFNAMGIYPLIYAALLIPAARSNKLPAWPFVCASVFLGAYALIPYMALWSPKTPPQQLPPPKEELEGWNNLYMKGAETPVLPALLAAGAAYYLFQAASAGGQAWLEYLRLFDESRLVHATSIDFTLCTLLAPFWMSNDAEGRNWEQRGTLVPLLSLLPLVGPAIYLILRPKTNISSDSA